MVNEIIEGVSVALDSVFGDGYAIYSSEEVEQGLREPCFFIKAISPSKEPKLTGRELRTCPLDIHYFSESAGNHAEINRVAGILFESLEYITLLNSDLLRGTGMHYEVVNGVLHFFVDYAVHLRTTEQADAMDDLKKDISVKGDSDGI